MQQLKVVLLGDQAVGKSSIVTRFITGDFRDQFDPTLGASYLGKIVHYPNRSLKFNIWDTAGQERFQSLAKLHYKDADVALFVYDLTSHRSFEGLKKWYEELENNGPRDIIKVVIGNKEDLVDREQVDLEEAAAFAETIDAVHRKTSAKNNTGIDYLFEYIASRVGPERRGNNSLRVSSRVFKRNKKKCCAN